MVIQINGMIARKITADAKNISFSPIIAACVLTVKLNIPRACASLTFNTACDIPNDCANAGL